MSKKFVEVPELKLAEDLLNAKSNAQEVVLLLCARIDALACCISHEHQSNRQSFASLLVNYAGHRDLMQSVSTGDLYYELGYHRWLIEGMIPKPGRLTRFSRVDDPIIHLLDRSGIPLTVEAARHVFDCKSGRTAASRFALSSAFLAPLNSLSSTVKVPCERLRRPTGVVLMWPLIW